MRHSILLLLLILASTGCGEEVQETCGGGELWVSGACRALCIRDEECGGGACVGGVCSEQEPLGCIAAIECIDFSTCATTLRCVAECPAAPADIANHFDDDCDGYVDEDAINACTNITCGGHGICALDGAARCICDSGYVPKSNDPLECVVATASPCDGELCSNHGNCTLVDGEPRCECTSGYISINLTCEPDPACTCDGKCEGVDDGCGNACGPGGCDGTCCDLICCPTGQRCSSEACCTPHTCTDWSDGHSYQTCEPCPPEPCPAADGLGPIEGTLRTPWCGWHDSAHYCETGTLNLAGSGGVTTPDGVCHEYDNYCCCDPTQQFFTGDNSYFEWVCHTVWR